LDRKLGGPQSWSGCGGEEKNSQLLPGLELPIIQPVAQHYANELSWLLLRRIYGPKRVEGRSWRKLHNDELHSLYSSPNIVRVIKSRRMRGTGHRHA
jgi:hypothetical protein